MSQYTPNAPLPEVSDARVAIVRAQWNDHITRPFAESAETFLLTHGLKTDDVQIFEVPGAIELTFAASQLIESGLFDAIIAVGCVIKGDTPHFDYVCQSVTQGLTHLNEDCDTPVIFGVLTVLTEQQALDRIKGGNVGDKGAEAGEAALRMIAFRRSVEAL